jgi:hypothetical protein
MYSLNILFKNSLSELIGLHQNILGILVWNNPKHIDEIQQLIGRIVRLNNWNNPVYFYITCTGGVEMKEEINNADNVEKSKLGMNVIDKRYTENHDALNVNVVPSNTPNDINQDNTISIPNDHSIPILNDNSIPIPMNTSNNSIPIPMNNSIPIPIPKKEGLDFGF